MDNSKMLTLGNGECIRLENHCAILFEVCKTKLKFKFMMLMLFRVQCPFCITWFHNFTALRKYSTPMIITYDMSSICNGSFAPCPIMVRTWYYDVWLLRSWRHRSHLILANAHTLAPNRYTFSIRMKCVAYICIYKIITRPNEVDFFAVRSVVLIFFSLHLSVYIRTHTDWEFGLRFTCHRIKSWSGFRWFESIGL